MVMMIWMQRIGQEVWIGPGKSPANVSRGQLKRFWGISTSFEACSFSIFLPFFVGFLAK